MFDTALFNLKTVKEHYTEELKLVEKGEETKEPPTKILPFPREISYEGIAHYPKPKPSTVTVENPKPSPVEKK